MRWLCYLGLHFKYITANEEVTKTSFKMVKQCECGKKKQYAYGGETVSENDFPSAE